MNNNRAYQEFRKMISSPRSSQRETLLNITGKNQDTLYGKKHGFSHISNDEQFKKKIPLNHYSDLKPYIERIIEGGENVLYREPTKAFFETSGTTSLPKYIPITSSFIHDKTKAMNIYWKLIYDKFPELKYQKIVANFSSGASFNTAKNGVLVGSETDYWNLLTQRIKKKSRWPIFYDLLQIKDYRTRYYCIALLLLQDEVGAFMSPNPSTLFILLKTIETNILDLIQDISRGEINHNIIPKGNYGTKIAEKIKPSPARAQELEKILESSGDKIAFTRIWPTLKLYICWQSAMLKPYTERVSSYLGDTDCWDHLYQASEALIAIPDKPNERGGILNIIGNYFEFIHYDECDSKDPATCNITEVEPGRPYEIVVTNSTGLYRYRIGDVVKILDFKYGTPRLEFIGRTGKICSMTGEKITEEQVVEAFEATRDTLNAPSMDYCIFPVDDELPHYGLILFPDDASSGVNLPGFVAEYEKHLCWLNIEYRSKRASKRLGAMEIFLVRERGLESCQNQEGQVTDQTKPARLSKCFNQHENFKIFQRAIVE